MSYKWPAMTYFIAWYVLQRMVPTGYGEVVRHPLYQYDRFTLQVVKDSTPDLDFAAVSTLKLHIIIIKKVYIHKFRYCEIVSNHSNLNKLPLITLSLDRISMYSFLSID